MTNPLHRYGATLILLAAVIAFATYDSALAVCLALGAMAGALSFRFYTHTRRTPGDERAANRSRSLHDSPAATVTDATREQAEALSASTLLEATMASMREGVLVVDRSMQVVAANRAAQELFGYADGETFVSRRLTELTRNPAIHHAFLAALERDERAEVKVEATGQQRRTFDIRIAPLSANATHDDGGALEDDHDGKHPVGAETEVQGAVGVFFDITRLERLERVRQEFLSNVSHELRTPLTAILTFVETLEEGAIDDAENNRRFLQIIRRNAARMQNLIEDILELSAIEAGTVRVEHTPSRLHNLVSDVFTALAALAATHRVELRNEVAIETIVVGDRNRLEQMLTNLVHNGIKFNTEGGTVTVRHERDDARARDLVSVADTGEGIAPEHLNRIFERFYRVDRARSRALGGTGLGLAIVKHLARAHGGEARVTSDAAGSTFTIELPVEAK